MRPSGEVVSSAEKTRIPPGLGIATEFKGKTALAGTGCPGKQPPRKLSTGLKKSLQLCPLGITPDEGCGTRGEG